MQRGVRLYLVVPLVTLALVGCRFMEFEQRDPWRAEAESQCLAGDLIQPSSFVEERPEINGRGTCGMTRPLHVAGVSQGFVAVEPKATLACPIVANVEQWLEEAIQPAAFAWFGEPVVQVKQISAYSCRTMNGQPGASISEHAFGNALDISTFRLASGREVNFKQGWKGSPDERGFLRNIHAAACERFTTVLAPGADTFHYDHIHVDLMRRPGRTVCKPAPQTVRPPAAPQRPIPQGVPMVRAPARQPAVQTRNEANDPFAISKRGRPVRVQAATAEPHMDPTSPWARQGTGNSPVRARGPAAVAREPDPRPVGAPLVLGNQAPPAHSFGTPLPIAERVRQSLGIGQQPTSVRAPDAAPVQPNPYRLIPPGRIPSARTGVDATVTGSIPKETKRKTAPSPSANLMSPQSVAEQKPSSEAASVFDLPAGRAQGAKQER